MNLMAALCAKCHCWIENTLILYRIVCIAKPSPSFDGRTVQRQLGSHSACLAARHHRHTDERYLSARARERKRKYTKANVMSLPLCILYDAMRCYVFIVAFAASTCVQCSSRRRCCGRLLLLEFRNNMFVLLHFTHSWLPFVNRSPVSAQTIYWQTMQSFVSVDISIASNCQTMDEWMVNDVCKMAEPTTRRHYLHTAEQINIYAMVHERAKMRHEWRRRRAVATASSAHVSKNVIET